MTLNSISVVLDLVHPTITMGTCFFSVGKLGL